MKNKKASFSHFLIRTSCRPSVILLANIKVKMILNVTKREVASEIFEILHFLTLYTFENPQTSFMFYHP